MKRDFDLIRSIFQVVIVVIVLMVGGGKASAQEASSTNILTPPAPATPRINGPRVFGVRPGNPLLYTIPATGDAPIHFEADHLPDGLSLDPATGQITGSVATADDYTVTLRATNDKGSDEKPVKIMVGNQISLTPPMGWNTYYGFRLNISDALVRQEADAMVSSGLINHGWNYISVDEGWANKGSADDPATAGKVRDSSGAILPNSKFPDMKALADYIHTKGLKIGLYSSPGPLCCGGQVGSYQHEDQDAQTFANWGVDYLKYDWCSYSKIYKEEDGVDGLKAPYQLMTTSLGKVHRDIVFSFCQYGLGNVWEWGADAGGNLWRTHHDIIDKWTTVETIGFGESGEEKYAGPGHWNDPDILQVGVENKGVPSRLTPDEQYAHVSLWCLLAAPLLIGGDMTKLDDFTLNLLTNDEVLAVDQDPLGKQAGRVTVNGTSEVWAKKMADGSLAVGLFNRGETDNQVTAAWTDLSLSGQQVVRDLWRQKDLGTYSDNFAATVPAHGVLLISIRPPSGP
jgi:alpha-galactosidase